MTDSLDFAPLTTIINARSAKINIAEPAWCLSILKTIFDSMLGFTMTEMCYLNINSKPHKRYGSETAATWFRGIIRTFWPLAQRDGEQVFPTIDQCRFRHSTLCLILDSRIIKNTLSILAKLLVSPPDISIMSPSKPDSHGFRHAICSMQYGLCCKSTISRLQDPSGMSQMVTTL